MTKTYHLTNTRTGKTEIIVGAEYQRPPNERLYTHFGRQIFQPSPLWGTLEISDILAKLGPRPFEREYLTRALPRAEHKNNRDNWLTPDDIEK